MADDETLLRQALEALESIEVRYRTRSGFAAEVDFDEAKCNAAIEALRARFAGVPVTHRRISDPEAREDVQRLIADITSSPEKAQAFLQQCGILTADGKRSPNFYPDDPDGVTDEQVPHGVGEVPRG